MEYLKIAAACILYLRKQTSNRDTNQPNFSVSYFVWSECKL